MNYCAAPRSCLRVVELDSLWAVYHRASGQTHLITAPVVAILEAIGDEALSITQIAERIGASHDHEAVAGHLAELTATGLVTAR